MTSRLLLFFNQFSIFFCCLLAGTNVHAQATENKSNHPKIVNIVNFIRLLEPRDANITEDVLYQTVVKQVEMMKKYKLGRHFSTAVRCVDGYTLSKFIKRSCPQIL